MEEETTITTTDNPFDPFIDFDNWFAFDRREGHNTLSLLARMAVTSEDLSEADNLLAIRQAIDEIVKENYSGMHIKVIKTANGFKKVEVE